MTTLLHLSDLHFGQKVSSPNDGYLTSKSGAKSLANQIFTQLNSKDVKQRIEPVSLIIISGDITDSAEPNQYGYAKEFIQELGSKLNLTSEKILIVPGNHDVDWNAKTNDDKFASFAQFYEGTFKETWNPATPVVRTFKASHDFEGICFGFNSTVVENKIWRGLGFIDPTQFEFVEKFLQESDKDYLVKIAVFHHHVLPVVNSYPERFTYSLEGIIDGSNERPLTSVMLNAPYILNKLKELEINAILHGHCHNPFRSYFLSKSDTEKHAQRRSITILGTGSFTSDYLGDLGKRQYQIIALHEPTKVLKFYLNSFFNPDGEKSITEIKLMGSVAMLGGAKLEKVTTEDKNDLRDKLDTIIKSNTVDQDTLTHDGDLIINPKFPNNMYDDILAEICKWIEKNHEKNFGTAIISKFNPNLSVYTNMAIYKYDQNVRNIAYGVNEQSITTNCARKKEPLIIPSVKKCAFHASKRDKYYRKSFRREDQTCMAIPIGIKDDSPYPYAIVEFARDKLPGVKVYDRSDESLLVSIAEIIESTLRLAEYAEIANRRRNLFLLFNEVNKWAFHEFPRSKAGVRKDLDQIIKIIYNLLGLKSDKGDTLGIFLPDPYKQNVAVCVSQFNFIEETVSQMNYRIGKQDGLTGHIIDNRKYDYCFNHLKVNTKSYRGHVTSRKCQKSSKPVVDHFLSFVGVPLGKGDKTYNKGALIINIALPGLGGVHNFIKQMYVEPLFILAQLLDPFIEDIWSAFFKKKRKPKSTYTNRKK